MTIVCLITAWGLLGWMAYIGISSCSQGVGYMQQIHQIPCSRCCFHTQCPALKCTVHPHNALTEAAIHCPDYESTSL